MKMTINEKKILFAFGCPNREVTVQRLLLVANLSLEITVKKALITLADKLDNGNLDKWYCCFFYNMKLEMEAYYRQKAIVKRIMGGSMEVDEDEIDED